MKKIIGGVVAIIIGGIIFAVFPQALLTILSGTIPILLIIGGCLAIYLKPEADFSSCETTPSPVETEFQESAPPEDIPDNSGNDNHKLAGNTVSHVFHNTDCKFAKGKNCTAFFNTRDEAIQADYKPCGICKP